MRWDPDDEYCDVDHSAWVQSAVLPVDTFLVTYIMSAVPHCSSQRLPPSEKSGSYLELPDQFMIINNDSDSVNDDLHEQLDFEYP